MIYRPITFKSLARRWRFSHTDHRIASSRLFDKYGLESGIPEQSKPFTIT